MSRHSKIYRVHVFHCQLASKGGRKLEASPQIEAWVLQVYQIGKECVKKVILLRTYYKAV